MNRELASLPRSESKAGQRLLDAVHFALSFGKFTTKGAIVNLATRKQVSELKGAEGSVPSSPNLRGCAIKRGMLFGTIEVQSVADVRDVVPKLVTFYTSSNRQ